MLKNSVRKTVLSDTPVFFFITSWSSGRIVTGNVFDDKNAPLSGASVSVKGILSFNVCKK